MEAENIPTFGEVIKAKPPGTDPAACHAHNAKGYTNTAQSIATDARFFNGDLTHGKFTTGHCVPVSIAV